MIHLTGTNGKTSTSRMIDTLLRALDLRTGRFTSPHVERMSERISVDGEPLSDEEFVAAFNDVAPYTRLVDAEEDAPAVVLRDDRRRWPTRGSRRRRSTWRSSRSAWAARGTRPTSPTARWRSCCRSRSTTRSYLGDSPAEIAVEKAGIIKPGAVAVLAEQQPDVAEVLLARAAEVGRDASCARAWTSAWSSRVPAVGGQVVSLQGLRARYDELFLPLYGAHQAQNAAVALAAVEAFVGGSETLDDELVRAAFAQVTSPGRLEIVRTRPDDRCSTPRTTRTAPRRRPRRSRTRSPLDPLIGVIGVMGDKDAEGLLAAFEPHLAHVVCTQNSTERAMPADELAVVAARGLRRGPGHRRAAAGRRHRRRRRRWPRPAVGRRRSVPAACWSPVRSSRSARPGRCCAGDGRERRTQPERSPAARHVRRGAQPRGDHPRPDHAGDDHGRRRGTADRAGGRAGARGARACWSPGCCAASGPTRSAGWCSSAPSASGFVIGADVLPRDGLRAAVGDRRTCSAARSSASARRRTPRSRRSSRERAVPDRFLRPSAPGSPGCASAAAATARSCWPSSARR